MPRPGPTSPGAEQKIAPTKEIMRSLKRYITRQLFRTLASAHPIPTTH